MFRQLNIFNFKLEIPLWIIAVIYLTWVRFIALFIRSLFYYCLFIDCSLYCHLFISNYEFHPNHQREREWGKRKEKGNEAGESKESAEEIWSNISIMGKTWKSFKESVSKFFNQLCCIEKLVVLEDDDDESLADVAKSQLYLQLWISSKSSKMR